MNLTLALFLLHCLMAFALTGIIWFVQIVVYPLLSEIPEENFAGYMKKYLRKTGWVAGIAMIVELITGIALLTFPQWRVSFFPSAMLLLAGIWLSTIFLQRPLYKKLIHGKNAGTLRQLRLTNWIRTTAWTGRAIILILISLG